MLGEGRRLENIGKGCMKRSVKILACLLACLPVVYFIKVDIDPETVSAPGYATPRKVQYGFTIRNGANRTITGAELWANAPMQRTSTQRRTGLTASHPYTLLNGVRGNQILHFELSDLPPYSVRTISIQAEFLLSDQAVRIARFDAAPDLEADRFIESDHPALIERARKLSAASPLQTAKNIQQWVSGHVRYIGYTRRGRGALYALRHKKGDCTEFMYLFAALARAAGIPARCMGGYVQTESGPLEPADYHNWAEFYHDGAWRIADPQRRVFMEKGAEYIATRVIDGREEGPMAGAHRFRFKGEDLTVRMR